MKIFLGARLSITVLLLTSTCSLNQVPPGVITPVPSRPVTALVRTSTPVPSATPTSVVVQTPISTVSPGFAYQNPEGYYSLTIPAEWVYKENSIASSTCKTELILSRPDIGFPGDYQGVIVIDLCQIVKEFYPRASFGNIDGDNITDTELDGVVGFEKRGRANLYKLGSACDIRRLVFWKNKVVYSIDYRYIPGMTDHEKAFNEVLRSFRFQEIVGK